MTPIIESVSSRCWGCEMEADLIEEIKKRNQVWDSRNPLYAKKNLKKASYAELAEILKQKWPHSSDLFTAKALIRKFSKMRSYYVRELKKMKDLNRTHTEITYYPRWSHFNRLSFLEDVVSHEDSGVAYEDSIVIHEDSIVIHEDSNATHANSISNLDISSLQSDTDLEAGFNTEAEVSGIKLEPLEPSEPSDSTFEVSSISSCKELERLSVEGRNNVRATRHSEHVNNEAKCTKIVKQNNDAEHFYGMFIASQLREIQDPKQRDLARIEIQRVLIKYKYCINS